MTTLSAIGPNFSLDPFLQRKLGAQRADVAATCLRRGEIKTWSAK